MKSKVFVLLLAVCLIVTAGSISASAISARDGEVTEGTTVATTVATIPNVTTGAEVTTAAPAITTAPTTTATTAETTGTEGGSVWGIILAVIAAGAIITLVVVLITPISLLVAAFIAKSTYHMFKRQSEIRGREMALMEEAISQHKVVDAFSQENPVCRYALH